MLRNAFTTKISRPDVFHVLVEFTPPAGEPPNKLLEFLKTFAESKPTWNGIDITGVTVTQNPSGAVTASPSDVIAHIRINGGMKGLEYIPHVSTKGMNRSEVETVLKGLLSYGVENCFIVTGDNPVSATPVFEIDSLNALRMVREMNADAVVQAGPGKTAKTLATGAAVGLAKYEEGTCLQQFIKLEKKVLAGGASFIITNIIHDVRKVEDFFRYLAERGLSVPVFGNVFFLHEPAARRMLDERIPGAYVSPELYQRIRSESHEDYILRAARQVAMWRELGARGADLGNVENLDLVVEILDKALEIGSSWREPEDAISFPPPMEDPYYVYTENGERTPLRDPDIPKKRVFLHWMHNLMFEPGSKGYEAAKYLFEHSKSIRNGEGLIYEATKLMEYVGKNALARCQACGDCYLPENFFVCVMGKCTKGLSNVPCGDSTIDGRCGADPSKLCAGRLVYDSARYFGEELSALRELVNPPKDPELRNISSLRNFFLGLDHRRRSPIIEVAELLHASIPRVKEAYEIIKSSGNGFEGENPGLLYLRMVIEAQALRGPAFIDINIDDVGGGDREKAVELMTRTVELVVRHGGGIPPCIDSSDEDVIRAGVETYYRLAEPGKCPPLVNSANKERKEFVWELQKTGRFSIVYMLMDSASAAGGAGEIATPEELEENAVGFFREAREKGLEPRQVFFDTTVIPLAIEFSRYQQPGFNYTAIDSIRRIMRNEEMRGVHTILGITNLTRDFPPGRKIGLLRAYLRLAMDAGLDAAIVDVRRNFGTTPPEDEEIVEIVRAFVEQDGSPEAYERMMKAYETYQSYGIKEKKART